jgi:3-oxoacyl-[acyl-carrier protein] reductase
LGCDISISYRHDAQAAAVVISGCRAAADLVSLHRLSLAFVPGMKHGFGKVIVISSGVAWKLDAPGLAAHGVSKAAMDAYTRDATFELASGAVAINSLQLGMAEKAGSSVVPAPARRVLAAATPAGHIATPEDTVGVVAPLAQPGSGWIKGTTVLVAVLSCTEHDPDEAS